MLVDTNCVSKFNQIFVQERFLELTNEDQLNIELAESVGVEHLEISYPQVILDNMLLKTKIISWKNIRCTLRKSESSEMTVETCSNISVPECHLVDVVAIQNITEDCRVQTEYCHYNFRTEEITQQTIICQKPADFVSCLIMFSQLQQ